MKYCKEIGKNTMKYIRYICKWKEKNINENGNVDKVYKWKPLAMNIYKKYK